MAKLLLLAVIASSALAAKVGQQNQMQGHDLVDQAATEENLENHARVLHSPTSTGPAHAGVSRRLLQSACTQSDYAELTSQCKCGVDTCGTNQTGKYCWAGGTCAPVPKCRNVDIDVPVNGFDKSGLAVSGQCDCGGETCGTDATGKYCWADPEHSWTSRAIAGLDQRESRCQEYSKWDFFNNMCTWCWGVTLIWGLTLILIAVRFAYGCMIDCEPEPEPTFWESTKSGFAKLFGLSEDQLAWGNGRRSDTGSLQLSTGSTTEAYRVLQVLSTTSHSTMTTLIVSQLQAANYTGAMPSLITTSVTSITHPGSSDSSDSDNTMILIAVVVAAVCLLLALLVIGALVYLWKRNKQPAQPSNEPATPHQITMGSVEAVMNPMHGQHMKMQQ